MLAVGREVSVTQPKGTAIRHNDKGFVKLAVMQQPKKTQPCLPEEFL